MSQATRSLPPEDRAFFETLVRVSLLVVLLGQTVPGFTDTDIWGHMAIGLDMLRSRQFMWVDPYSFTSDLRWVNHEWLWDVSVAAIYSAGGLPGLIVLRAALNGAVIWVIDRAVRNVPSWLRLVTVGAVVVACAPQWKSTRPQMATLICVVIVLQNIEAWWLPLMFVVWANLHGGWMYGLAAVGLFAAVTRTPRAFAVAAACAVATLVTPYGVREWLALAEAVTRGWGGISEWEPVWRLAEGAGPLLLWIALAIVVALMWLRTRHDLFAWSFSLLALAAAANSRRLIALAGVSCTVLLVPQWKDRGVDVPFAWTSTRRWMLAAVAAVAALTAIPAIRPTLVCFTPLPGWIAPESDAVAFLRNTGVTSVVPYFDFGEYAIFHLRDRMRVAIDNRRETVYSAAVVEANARFSDGFDPDYPDRIAADAVWWPVSGEPLIRSLEERGWFRRFEGPSTVVLMKSSGPVVHGDKTTGRPCFPNP